jgi:tetratricopeptide (TPR) repeat protein
MLYYIVPPLIIIVCLAILISFLFRKASQIPPREFSHPAGGEERGFRKILKSTNRITGQLTLKTLERLMQWFKLLSLKFYNLCQKGFQSIRKKRERSATKAPQHLSQQEEIKKTQKPEEEERPIFKTDIVRKREIRGYPMVSEKVVHPEPQAEMKSRLEAALIERIAANPQDIEAYERLGDYYFEQGNHHDALECFRQVLKLSPANRKARVRLKRLERISEK